MGQTEQGYSSDQTSDASCHSCHAE